MSRWTRLAAGAALVAVCFAAARIVRGAQSADAQNSAAQKAAAQKAAEQWLALVDAGKYGESWDQSAEVFKKALSRKDWQATLKEKLPPLGRLESRKLIKADTLRNVPGLPPGQYIGMQFATSFAKSKSTAEVVVAVLEKDGQWRVLQYAVQPTP